MNCYENMDKRKFMEEYKKIKKDQLLLSTCVRTLDEKSGGLQKGRVSTILGGTGMLKTTWALNIAYAAQTNGLNTLYLSMEILKFDVYCDLLSRHSNQMLVGTPNKFGIEHRELKQKRVDEYSIENVLDDYEKLKRKVVHS